MSGNFTKKNEDRLPKGWIKNRSKSHKDRFYYFNTKTGETQWHPPTAEKNNDTSESVINHSKKPPQLKRNPFTKIKDKTPAQNRLEVIRKNLADENEIFHKDSSSKPAVNKDTKTIVKKPQRIITVPRKLSTIPKKLPESTCATTLLTNFKIPKIKPSATATGDAKSSDVNNIIQESTLTETVFKIPKVPIKRVPPPITNSASGSTTSSTENLNDSANRKRKFDDVPQSSESSSSSSLSTRLVRIQEECRAKQIREDIPSIVNAATTATITAPLLKNADNLSEQELSKIRAKLIFQLKNEESLSHDQLSDDDVSMKTESIPSSTSSSNNSCEEMDWQEIVFDEISVVRDINYAHTSSSNNGETTEIQESSNDLQLSLCSDENLNHLYIVIDTNVFLHDLLFVRELISTNRKIDCRQPIVVIPYIVLQELDKLKMRKNNVAISTAAAETIHFINQKFSEKNRQQSNLFGQSSLDDGNHLITIDSPDDRILNCCLQFHTKGYKKNLLLLSNDVNLRNKALVSDIQAASHRKLNSMLNN